MKIKDLKDSMRKSKYFRLVGEYWMTWSIEILLSRRLHKCSMGFGFPNHGSLHGVWALSLRWIKMMCAENWRWVQNNTNLTWKVFDVEFYKFEFYKCQFCLGTNKEVSKTFPLASMYICAPSPSDVHVIVKQLCNLIALMELQRLINHHIRIMVYSL